MLNLDSPIQKVEDDKLNRGRFTEELTQAILNNPCFVFGLYGKWGSGKTSIINLAIEQIDKLNIEQRPIIMKFNPWLCADQNQLVSQFFKQLRRSACRVPPAIS